MKDSFLMGMALGFIVGAVIVSNNNTAQKMVEKGKKTVKKAMNEVMAE